MNLNKQIKNVGMAAVVASLSLLSSTALNAATVTFDGGNLVIDQSENTVTLNLIATGLDLTTSSVGLGIRFDETVVSFNSASIDPFWNVAPNEANPTTDTYEFRAASIAGIIVGGGPDIVSQGVASITFNLDNAGSFAFEFYSLGTIGDWGYKGDVVPNEPVGLAYCLTLDTTTCLNAASSDIANLHLDLVPTTLTVTSTVIPVPAAVWLFGSGLIGLVAVSRRKA